MLEHMLHILRCPVTKSPLQLQIISTTKKLYDGEEKTIIQNGILFSENDWFYPVINGIPRLLVEAYEDYESFFRTHLQDYDLRKRTLGEKYQGLIKYVKKKNNRTKASFTQEWGVFNYDKDKTWDADKQGMLQRFLKETNETDESIKGKLIFDAGCGNGLLNLLIAEAGATVLSMDFSFSIERAYERNKYSGAFFIQGDVQFPPVAFSYFDIVHSSGVLIATDNTELSFSCIETCVKPGGKLSVWLYHPRKDVVHNAFNFARRITTKLPLKFQYRLYQFTLLPISYVVKRLKGNKQNTREMMIDILDGLTPEFRREHTQDEAATWFYKRNYTLIKVTAIDLFGFNIIGSKRES
jgi:2-polyprenyl-3-methyl-5-hydroxy-6-metoxy-1,4-benzoquinol methylase/uncharacterized protein YbaR (Trm112 family)